MAMTEALDYETLETAFWLLVVGTFKKETAARVRF